MSTQSPLNKVNRIHFIGIYGVSLSSLALLSAHRGYNVSGSDTDSGRPSVKNLLTKANIAVSHGNVPENLPTNLPPSRIAVVHTAAVTEDNPELRAARAMGMRIFGRTEFMELMTADIPTRIGVAGTHGKSTVCGMLASIFISAGLDPDVLCGAEFPTLGAMRIGSGERMIYEACEYKNSFLKLHPTHAVVTNIEEDHPDFFADVGEIRESFFRYADSASAATVCIDSDEGKALAVRLGDRATTCSVYTENADYFQRNARAELGRYTFTLCHREEELCDVTLKPVGRHNLQNAVTAAAVAIEHGVSPEFVKAGLESFNGVKRRMEYRGTVNGALIYDDYAHHPTEIKATLSAAKAMGFDRMICAFQPHTYSRTAKFFNEFTTAFSDADQVIFADIYAARETNGYGIHSRDLAAKTPNAIYIPTPELIAEYMKANAKPKTLLLTMGAGVLDRVADMILSSDSE